jgi:hypothetical protein
VIEPEILVSTDVMATRAFKFKVIENKDVFIFRAISKGQFYAQLLVTRVPILSTLPKNRAAWLSIIVSLSRKLSNVPSMFLLTSQLTNSTVAGAKQIAATGRHYQPSTQAIRFYRLLP